MDLSQIKRLIKNKLGIKVEISRYDTEHFLPHLHVFTGEDFLVLDLTNFEILAPDENTLKQSSKEKTKTLIKFLRKDENKELLEKLIDYFYLYNPHIKRQDND